jgi:hypothetical protein
MYLRTYFFFPLAGCFEMLLGSGNGDARPILHQLQVAGGRLFLIQGITKAVTALRSACCSVDDGGDVLVCSS